MHAWSHSVDLQPILVEAQPVHVTDHILIVMHVLRSCYGVWIHGWHAGAFTLIVLQISKRSHQQAITLTSDIPTWRIKCPQSRKNCQIYPTKCRKNVMERKFLFSIISYWFSAWIKPCKPRFIMGENGGCWQSCRSWPQTLPLNCSNQFTLMPLFFSHVN